MLKSAQNFAAGFFGIPAEEQYNLEVMIEWPGFNCTLAPYHSCPNDGKVYGHVNEKLAQWDKVFLDKAVKRVQKLMDGFEVTSTDVLYMVSTAQYYQHTLSPRCLRSSASKIFPLTTSPLTPDGHVRI